MPTQFNKSQRVSIGGVEVCLLSLEQGVLWKRASWRISFHWQFWNIELLFPTHSARTSLWEQCICPQAHISISVHWFPLTSSDHPFSNHFHYHTIKNFDKTLAVKTGVWNSVLGKWHKMAKLCKNICIFSFLCGYSFKNRTSTSTLTLFSGNHGLIIPFLV